MDEGFGTLEKVTLFADIFLGTFTSYKLCKCLLVQSLLISIVGMYQICTANQINHFLKIVQIKSQQNGQWRSLTNRTIIKLQSIYKIYSLLCIYHMKASQEFWSLLLGGYYLLSVPFNVLLVMALMSNIGWFPRYYVMLFLLIHVIMTLFPTLMSAKQSKALHQIRRTLIPVVISIKTNLILKLKFDNLYNRLENGKKYGINVAILGTLTYNVIYKVFN